MSHMIWKGAISFGLVHVPVQLYPATQSEKVGFNLLDKRSIDLIGYRQINKRTGKEVTRDNIVRGFEYEKDRYVVLSDDKLLAGAVNTNLENRGYPRLRPGTRDIVFVSRHPRIFWRRTARARRSTRCCARR